MATRKINVIACEKLRSGLSDSGKEWTLYDVTAVDMDGAPIEEKLKSFDLLDGDVEVEIERQDHEKYGVSFMLKPAGAQAPSPGARLGPKVDQQRSRIDELENALAGLRNVVMQHQQALEKLGADFKPPFDAPEEPTF